MNTCKICEKNVPAEKLGLHSAKCFESTQICDQLKAIVERMDKHRGEAIRMKNSVETHAMSHMIQTKKGSSRDLLGTPSSSRIKSSSSIHNAGDQASPKKNMDTEGSNSEDGKYAEDGKPFTNPELPLTPQKEKVYLNTLSTQETSEPTEESPTKRFSKEENQKFMEEAKLSIAVLQKVSHLTQKISDWGSDLSPVTDLGPEIIQDLEADERLIESAKVSEFLRILINDIDTWLNIREKYFDCVQELYKISSPQSYHANRLKLALKRSSSSKPNKHKNERTFVKMGSMMMSNKSKDEIHSSSLPSKKDSPVFERRKIASSKDAYSPTNASRGSQKSSFAPINVTTEQPSSPSTTDMMTPANARKAALRNNYADLINNEVNLQATPQNKPKRMSEFARNLLQNNSNHIMGLNNVSGVAQTTKKPTEDGISLKDRMKANFNLAIAVEKTPVIAEVELMSPSNSTIGQAREQMVRRRGRVTVCNSPYPNQTKPKPSDAKQNESEKKSATLNNPVKITVPPHRRIRTNSMEVFKSLRREDSVETVKFPSIFNNGKNSSSTDEFSPKMKNSNSNLSSGTSTKQKSKKEDSKDTFESPTMRGYYSDCNASRSRRRISQDSNHISLDDFEIIKFLGKGAYGTVMLAKKKATGDYYAIKMVDTTGKNGANRLKSLKDEENIYRKLKGDYVVKAIWTFQNENMICFVTEYMIGGDFNKILDRLGRLEENQAKFYFAELVLAVESLHNLKIVHRDLKPDNILMDAKGHIRLTDFGLSQKEFNELRGNGTPGRKASTSPASQDESLSKSQKLGMIRLPSPTGARSEFRQRNAGKKEEVFTFFDKEDDHQIIMQKKPLMKRNIKEAPNAEKKRQMVGTPDYMAPEIIRPDEYSFEDSDEKPMDWWSMGAILYQFLVGIPPFNDETEDKVFDNIVNLRMEWPEVGDDEDCISHNAHDLIKRLLTRDPKKRIGSKGVQEIKNHPFFNGIDWDKIRDGEAPIIPRSLEEEIREDEKGVTPQIFGRGFGEMKRSGTVVQNYISFGPFGMRRLDLLHEENQKQSKIFKRQNSGNLDL